jgi:hypothetical protein
VLAATSSRDDFDRLIIEAGSMLVRSSYGVERSLIESVGISVGSLCDDWPISLHQLAKVRRFVFDASRPGDDS